MNKRKAIILQILTFFPAIYFTLFIIPDSKITFALDNIENYFYLLILQILIFLITFYLIYFIINPMFKYNKQKKIIDYIWYFSLFFGMYTLPIYWYLYVIKKYNNTNYIYIYRQDGKANKMLNEKEGHF
jgi:hypothetical protein